MSEEATVRGRSRRFRIGVRIPEFAIGSAFRLFEGVLDYHRTAVEMELSIDQPSGGDLPPSPVDENWEGDGLLVYRYTPEECVSWRSRGIAVVNLSSEYPEGSCEIPRVTMDNGLVARLAFEHLSSLGLREFAYVHESTRLYSAERLESFRHLISQAGGTLHQIDVPASSYEASERPERIDECISGPLAALPRPCGILTKDDIAGVWTLRKLRQLGVHCPDDMPVLGVANDLVFCHTTDPPLSSVPYPAKRIGYAAVELLHRMMAGERVAGTHRELVSPGAIVARESTRRVVLRDPVMTRAMEFIRAELGGRSLRVDELCRAVGVSRESLRQRFQKALGRSPKQEIERLRCQHVSEMLRRSGDNLEVIAELSGFSGSDDLCRFMKRMTGKTPGAIRREGSV